MRHRPADVFVAAAAASVAWHMFRPVGTQLGYTVDGWLE